MLEFFYNVDISILFFFNKTLSNPVFDKFFVTITDVKSWLLVYIIFWFLMFFKGDKKSKLVAVMIILLIIVSDQISSNLIKSLVSRIRPCHIHQDLNLLLSCKNSFSFPSSHAVNNFAAATYLSFFFNKYKNLFITTAILVSISRVYLGLHYPSDIIAGAMLGALIGYLFYIVTSKIYLLFFKDRSDENKT